MLIFDQIKKGDRPLWVLAAGILGGMLLLLGGLWYMQVLSSQRYTQSQKTQSVRQVRFPALRGKILDRNGVALAENRPAYNINLYIEELGPQFDREYRRLIAARFGPPAPKRHLWQRLFHWSSTTNAAPRRLTVDERQALRQRARFLVSSNVVFQAGQMLHEPVVLDEKKFQTHFGIRRALPMPVIENVSSEQVALFLEPPSRPPGLSLDTQGLRTYPHGTLAAHLLGNIHRMDDDMGKEEPDVDFDYCLPDYEGQVGIEAAFDQQLRGHAGAQSVIVNNMGYRQSEKVWSPPESGMNVVLTLDARIQKAAEKALASHGPETKGAVVVLDPRNGDVLALASSPTYDPNSFVPRMSVTDWARLSDTNLNAAINRATYGSYAPGSIFKIVIGLAGLEAGTLDPKEIYRTQGFYRFNARYSIHDLAAPGDYDFRRALLKSSNEYFVFHGLKVGLDKIMDLGGRLFLGQRTRIPTFQELSGFFPTPAWVEKQKRRDNPIRPADIGNLCIGQGYLTVTPLQMAIMTAAVANGGNIFWPRLVDRLEPREAGTPPRLLPAAQLRGELGVRAQNLQIVRDAMLADVEDPHGTGTNVFMANLRICGKTGTAQVKLNGVLTRHDVWFVSFAPYENPRYAVVVIVEGGGSGGGTCAPLARQIYQVIKQIDALAPRTDGLLAKRELAVIR